MDYLDVVEALCAKSSDFDFIDWIRMEVFQYSDVLRPADYEDICAIINNADSIDTNLDYRINTICKRASKRRFSTPKKIIPLKDLHKNKL